MTGVAETRGASGLQIPGYAVGELLGAGGFGQVFAARHEVIGREVAIKVLHAKYSADPAAVKRFVDEARAVNTISHPGIVEIFDFGTLADGRQYCVMERLRGETLRNVLRERARLPLADALPLLTRIAHAVDAAHAAGIAHRDLKPDNVFVLSSGEIKLIDFGLAKLFADGDPSVTETGSVFGTPLYMSPEQCRGRAITTATDAYSFGVLTYYVLVGEPPFTGDALEIALHHLNDPPPSASARAPELPPSVDRVIAALLAKEPSERPTSLVDAVDRLAGAVEPTPRRARWPWVVALVAAAGIGTATIVIVQARDGSRTTSTSPRHVLRSSLEGALRVAGSVVSEPREADDGLALMIDPGVSAEPDVPGRARELLALSEGRDDVLVAADVFRRSALFEDLSRARERLRTIDARDPALHLLDVWLLRAAGNTDGAIASNVRGLAETRSQPPSEVRIALRRERAELLTGLGRIPDALVELDAAESDARALGIDLIELTCTRALLLDQSGDGAGARALLTATIAADPGAFLALHVLAAIQIRAGQPSEALANLDRADAATVLRGVVGDRMWILHDRMRAQEALLDPRSRAAFDQLVALVEAHPDRERLSINTGVAWWALGPFGELTISERGYTRMLAVAEKAGNLRRQAMIRYELGRVYGDQGRTAEAIQMRLAAVADTKVIDRELLAVHQYGLGILYVEVGHYAKAVEQLEATDLESRGRGSRPNMARYRVRALVGAGRLDDARALFATVTPDVGYVHAIARTAIALADKDTAALATLRDDLAGRFARERLIRDRYRIGIPLAIVERALGRGTHRLEELKREAASRGYGLAAEQARKALAGEPVY